MSILHLCNTFFEWELCGETPDTLEEAFAQNPIFLQLQFLPLLYANRVDGLLVTQKPSFPIKHHLCLIDEFPPFDRLETWGYSQLAKAWAVKHNITYEMPPWEVVQMVNSKSYSFAKSPLPGAHLIVQGDPIPPHCVLKNCFGTAGRGLIFSDHPKAQDFCQKQWHKNLPVIAEPWVERQLDFSTQWNITTHHEVQFLGVTFCSTTSSGMHQSNTVGIDEGDFNPFIEKQKEFVKEILQEMAEMGYFGPVGFDAMIYNQDQLQPVVEINARKTMGWVTLQFQQQQAPDQVVELAYVSSKGPGLLPEQLDSTIFSKQLYTTTHVV